LAGDSVLLAFGSVASALRWGLRVQQQLVAQANPQTGTLRLPLRILAVADARPEQRPSQSADAGF